MNVNVCDLCGDLIDSVTGGFRVERTGMVTRSDWHPGPWHFCRAGHLAEWADGQPY